MSDVTWEPLTAREPSFPQRREFIGRELMRCNGIPAFARMTRFERLTMDRIGEARCTRH
jgi:hypothetical protein